MNEKTLEKNKEETIQLVRECIACRFSTKESLDYLKEKKITISERTLRRYKQEIKNECGLRLVDIFQKEVYQEAFQDLLSLQQIQKNCWALIQDEKTATSEKIRLFNCIQKIFFEKCKLYDKIPRKFRFESDIYTNPTLQSSQTNDNSLQISKTIGGDKVGRS